MEVATIIAVRREPGPLTRGLVALLLRVGLGMMFLMVGLDKFRAIRAGDYPGMITKQFEKAPLRPEMVKLFADVLPYAEVGLGAALIAGVLTTLSAALAGALLLHLFFGQILLHNLAMFPTMLTYLLVDAAVLWLSPVTSNYLSVDGLLFGWFWSPKSDGEFRREDQGKRRS